MTERIGRIVLLPGEPIPDDGQEWIQVPKGNDRFWKVTMVTRRGRTITIRRRVAGPVVITCIALDGPVASRATKH